VTALPDEARDIIIHRKYRWDGGYRNTPLCELREMFERELLTVPQPQSIMRSWAADAEDWIAAQPTRTMLELYTEYYGKELQGAAASL
jgi:hypothetical protein